jgi:DNA-binding response OmpR family regulator
MPKDILIVEDEPDEARAMQLILEGAGFRVSSVQTVREAMKFLRVKKPDLVILDIILPLQLGNVLLEEMRDTGIKVPVVVVTAISKDLTSVERDIRKINKGIGFIQKPFTASRLISEINKKIA